MPDKDNKEEQGMGLGASFRKAADSTLRNLMVSNPVIGAAVLSAELAVNPEKRERVFTGVQDGVRDFVRDVPWAAVWLVDKGGEWLGYDHNTGDRGWSDSVAQGVEDFWDEYIKRNTGLGEAEFRMAAGWQLPKDVKYNGKDNPVYPPGKDDAGQPITEIRDITAIFYKDPKGKLEVLTQQDPKWAEIVGPYLATQIGQMVASMGAGAAFKGAVTMPRAVTYGVKLTTGTVGALEAGGSVGFLANDMILEPLYFKPGAMQDLTRMFANPASLNTDNAREALNTMTSQYSHLTGTLTEQTYIKSLGDNDAPWKRLDQVSLGKISGFRRDNPFDDIRGLTEADRRYGEYPNTNIRNLMNPEKESGIKPDPRFMSSYYDLASRALNGGLDLKAKDGLRLSDQEVYSLRFMLNITQDYSGHLDLTRGPIPANQSERREIRQETLDNLREATKGAVNLARYNGDPMHLDDEVSIKDIRSYTAEKSGEWKELASAQQAQEESESMRMGQAMAMSMMP